MKSLTEKNIGGVEKLAASLGGELQAVAYTVKPDPLAIWAWK